MHFFLNKYFVLRHITRLNKLVDYVHYFNMNVERFLQRDRIVSAYSMLMLHFGVHLGLPEHSALSIP